MRRRMAGQLRGRTEVGILTAILGAVAIGIVACGPAAEATATTAPRPTVATQPTATTAAVASATKPAQQEAKFRFVPVLDIPAPNPLAQKGGIYRSLGNEDAPDYGIWEGSAGYALGGVLGSSMPTTGALLDTNQYQPDKRNQILPALAYDWWTDEKGTTWTFKLKEGVKFHDGVEFTCADAKFMLDTIRLGRDATGDELRRSPRGALVRRVKETRCPDKYTFEVVTDGPMPSLAATVSLASFAILPKHVYEGHLDLWLTKIGTGLGPFKFKEYRPTDILKLERNPNYWQTPYPYLDELHHVNLGSVAATTAAFRVGRAEELWSKMNPALRNELESQGKIYVQGKYAEDGMLFFQPNWQRKPWNDPRFALAVRCAIDSRKVIDTALNGEGFEGPFFPLASTPGGNEWAISEAEWKAIHPCHGPSGDAANMEKRRQLARDLLGQLGFNAQNPAKPTSYRSASDPSYDAILEDFAKVSIIPQLRVVTTADRYSIQAAGEADLFQQGTLDSRRDPDHWLYVYFYSTSDRNYGKYANPEVDALIDKQSKTLDKAERYKLVQQIEKKVLSDNAMISVRHGYFIRQLSPWVKDTYWGTPSNSQHSGGRFAWVWLDQDVFKKMAGN